MAVEQVAQAFRQEFYEGEGLKQRIKTDLVSYLGEYRFKVSEFSYTHGILNGTIVDPITKEAWVLKTQKAIAQRLSEGLSSSREQAELTGFQKLEEELGKNPQGTVVWLSPQGPRKEGYGDYGFAYVGQKIDDRLHLTAIRIERPVLDDFNRAKEILAEGGSFEKAEDFISSPWVVDKEQDDVRAIIYEHFWINDAKGKYVFNQAILEMGPVLDECAIIIENGTSVQKQIAFNTVENLAIEVKNRLELKDRGKGLIWELSSSERRFAALMQMEKYNKQAEKVAGSCGSSGVTQSNDIFNSLSTLRSLFPNGEKWEYHTGQCRVCSTDGVDVGPCSICRGCEEKFNESWE